MSKLYSYFLREDLMKHITRHYHLFDAKGKILGRLATEIAHVLNGKGRVDYTPHIDAGDFVVVVNANQVDVTGAKEKQKEYHNFSGYPGGLHTITLEKLRKKDARKIIEAAVYGMLPKNKLRAKRMNRLLVFQGEDHGQNTIHVTHN